MENQALEALATLASVAPSPSDGNGADNAGTTAISSAAGTDSREPAVEPPPPGGAPDASGTTNPAPTPSVQQQPVSTVVQQPHQQASLPQTGLVQQQQANQWQQQQALAAAATAGLNAAGLSAQHLALLGAASSQQPQQLAQTTDPSLLVAQQVQNMAYFQLLMQQSQQAAAAAQTGPLANALAGLTTTQALAPAAPQAAAPLAAFNHAAIEKQLQEQAARVSATEQQRITPSTTASSLATISSASDRAPAVVSSQAISASTAGIAAPSAREEGGVVVDTIMDEVPPEDKKQQKRAANRRSAQLSRKRKKQFIEELKEENDELRRKEQILKSIPDLVVVFDSGGKLWFVSQSVSRFLRFQASELEGTSFWDRLCEDSVRLLKAAFMDSLAARQPHMDTAALGSGVWELRLVDKDGSQKVVALNGVVHFAGDRPECVCSIRPRDGWPASATKEAATGSTQVSLEEKALRTRIKPQQSVVRSESRSSGDSTTAEAQRKVKHGGKGGREAVRISDSGNSSATSGDSESGSSDELIEEAA